VFHFHTLLGWSALAVLPSCGSADPRNLDLVAEPTDAQNLLSLADGKGNEDQLGLASRSTDEKRTTACFSASPFCSITVSRWSPRASHRVRSPVGDGRSVRTQFGRHGLAQAHRAIELIGL